MAEDNEKGISRRGLLRFAAKGAAVATVASYPAASVLSHQLPEVFTGLGAFLAREGPPKGSKDTFDLVKEISPGTLESMYQVYFQGREKIMPKHAWMAELVLRGGGVSKCGFGLVMARIATRSYEKEKGKGESFDAYFQKYMKGLKESADSANLDFIVLVGALQITAENVYDLQSQQSDVTITRIQQLPVPLLKRFQGLPLPQLASIQENLRPGHGLYTTLQKVGVITEETTPREPDNTNAYIRLASQPTLGMMDMETSLYATALLVHGTPEMRNIFKTEYPDLVIRYQKILQELGIKFNLIIDTGKPLPEKQTIESTRKYLDQLIAAYIKQFKEALDVFGKSETQEDKNKQQQALVTIGIDENNLDPWQKYNYTDIFYQLVKYEQRFSWGEIRDTLNQKESEKKAVEKYKEEMLKHDFYSKDEAFQRRFYEQLMRQQIRNPKFIQFLKAHAENSKLPKEKELVSKLEQTVKIFENQSANVSNAVYMAEQIEGRKDFDSVFQQRLAALTIKMLSSEAGPFNPNDFNSVYWHIFRLVAIREISHPFTVVHDTVVARYPFIDMPYARVETLHYLSEFEELLLTRGIIQKPAHQDIEGFLHAFDDIQNNRVDKYDLTEGEKKDLKEFFRFHITETPETAIHRSIGAVWNFYIS